MTVTGLFNPSHILRVFLAKEYAFEIRYPDQIVRIAHGKGTWDLAKLNISGVIDFLAVQDYGAGVTGTNTMSVALFKKIGEDILFGDNLTREKDAQAIEKALSIWGGDPKTIQEIVAVQPGRNACINERTGEFDLSARQNEFFK